MEGQTYAKGEIVEVVADGTYTSGDIIQVADGRAGVVRGDYTDGQTMSVEVTEGLVVTVPKTTSMVVLDGTDMYWDNSANKTHLLQRNDKDFFAGCAVGDATSSATTHKIALNQRARYTHSLGQGFSHVKVCTAGLMVGLQGAGEFVNGRFDVTAEAQKLDALGIRGIAVGTPCIVDMLVCINVAPDNAAVDLNIGIANETHASDADSIGESMFVHLDGNNANINIEADDGVSGEVAATDSTVDWTAGTPFLVQFDARAGWADIQVYIDGVQVLSGSTFKLSGATGPIRPLAHFEKGADDSPGNITCSIGIRAQTVSTA